LWATSNGKWNYEVVVRTNGKESGFELDPKGKFLRQHAKSLDNHKTAERPLFSDVGIALVTVFGCKRPTARRLQKRSDHDAFVAAETASQN
jgi:hypothetical protein